MLDDDRGRRSNQNERPIVTAASTMISAMNVSIPITSNTSSKTRPMTTTPLSYRTRINSVSTLPPAPASSRLGPRSVVFACHHSRPANRQKIGIRRTISRSGQLHCVLARSTAIEIRLSFSGHALTRMDQRAVSPQQVAYAVSLGKIYDRAGARWYTLRRKDIPASIRKDRVLERAVGLIVCTVGCEVETVYKRDRPSIYIRKKSKYDRRPTHRRRSERLGADPLYNQGVSAS